MSDTLATLTFATPHPHVSLVTINRPEASNALNTQLAKDLMVYFEALTLDARDIRCVVLTGSGAKAFCAGADLKERNHMTNDGWAAQHLIFERMLRAILDCPTPVIAAVNGAAYGGGCEIAAACDFIYAADHARFALTEVTLGIMPGCGGTQTLPRAVGERRAKEIIMTGKPFGASDALAWGFANRILPHSELVEEAARTASVIAQNAPVSVRQIKQAIHRGLQMSLGDGLAFEIETYNRTVPTADRTEGVLAFNEKRRPQFKGR